jgi:hypothetical protein
MRTYDTGTGNLAGLIVQAGQNHQTGKGSDVIEADHSYGMWNGLNFSGHANRRRVDAMKSRLKLITAFDGLTSWPRPISTMELKTTRDVAAAALPKRQFSVSNSRN